MSTPRDRAVAVFTESWPAPPYSSIQQVAGSAVDALLAHPEVLRDLLDGVSDSDTEWEPGRWWRVTMPDGSVWTETSDEREARRDLARCPGGGTLYRLFQRSESEWRTVE